MCLLKQKKMTVLYAFNLLNSRRESSFIDLRKEINQHRSVVSKEVEDALLGAECRPSSVTSNPPQVSAEESSSDPLQLILRLDDIQGQITSLKSRTSEVPASNLSINSEGEASEEDTSLPGNSVKKT